MNSLIDVPGSGPDSSFPKVPSSLAKALALLSPPITGERRPVPLNEAIETLGVYWPHLFPYGILRPMDLDITLQLITDKQARKLPLTAKRLTQCVSVILLSVAYQSTLMPGAIRYDISGHPQGVVTKEEM